MRFHTLVIEGFGPFAGTETIDFDRLGAEGLFLLAGPTGAGKTTILDAICYALFGETTGEGQATGAVDGRTGTELRSSGAAADRGTEVTLTFSVGGRTWRVQRNPDHERRARRGEGMTRQLAKATLHRAGPAAGGGADWEPVAMKIREVNERIVAITGFTADQFRRVIVIPQNRFRDVLVSEADQREELLRRIFGTDVYKRFEGVVTARRSAAETAWATICQERDALLAPHAWASALDDTAVATEIGARIVTAAAAAEEAKRELAEATARHTRAAEALGSAREVANLARVVAEARSRDRRAQDALAGQAAARAELAAALAAAEPIRLLEERKNRDRQHAEALEGERAAEAAAITAARELEAARAALGAATEAHGRTTTIATRLGAIASTVTVAAEARGRLESAADAVRDAEAREAAAARGDAAARAVATTAVAATQAADAVLAATRARFQAGAAARLAADLAADAPCPVCGSVTHPRPATSAGDVPTEADIEELGTALAAAREAERTTTREAAKAAELLAVARASAEEARHALAALPAAPDVTALEDEQHRLEKERNQLDEALRSARKALDDATATARDRDATRDAARATLILRDGEAMAARTASETALAASIFASSDELVAAARAEPAVAALQASIAAAERDATEAAAALATALDALAGRTPPDVTALEAAQREIAVALDRARSADESARGQVREYEGLREAHAALAGRFAAAALAHRTVHALHQKVTGQCHPTDKVSLHRWVLGAVLEEVVVEATVMLREMSRGRYELVRAEAGGDRKTRAGLEIDVLDTWHGTRRPARTLSGGETFLASLALSLALARTAERHAGGRRLETVFIDEGFGSLDAETLEFAMQTLTSLRDQGRVVGLISHVDEMQRAIPVQLRVERKGDTSTTRIVGAGAAAG